MRAEGLLPTSACLLVAPPAPLISARASPHGVLASGTGGRSRGDSGSGEHVHVRDALALRRGDRTWGHVRLIRPARPIHAATMLAARHGRSPLHSRWQPKTGGTARTSSCPRPQKSFGARPVVLTRAAPVVSALASTERVLITGGNTGIGRATALELAKQGFDVTLACRDEVKAAAAVKEILNEVPSANVDYRLLDLGNLDSVETFVKNYAKDGQSLDILINNAGVMATPEVCVHCEALAPSREPHSGRAWFAQMKTDDGFEFQLGINHLGHFLLTLGLLPTLKRSAAPRVINLSSSAHQFVQKEMDFDDLNLREKGAYSEWKAYGQSKLANVYFSYELQRQNPDMYVNAVHPGLVNTELGRYLISNPESVTWWQKLLFSAMGSLAKTPAQGAESSIYLASEYVPD
eukprot:scaffold7382_cov406-Prasinococcus_capsulatus_cf.AAC.13